MREHDTARMESRSRIPQNGAIDRRHRLIVFWVEPVRTGVCLCQIVLAEKRLAETGRAGTGTGLAQTKTITYVGRRRV